MLFEGVFNRNQDIPYYEEPQPKEETQSELQNHEPAHSTQVEKDEEPKRNKDLPESAFFNTPENPPTFQEKMKDKTKRVLWNK